jgi:SecD-like export protein
MEHPAADLARRLPELSGVVEEYRGLRFEHPVPMNTVTRGELGEQFAARLEIGNRSAFGDVERLEIGLAAFGLIPRSMNLRDNYPQSIAAGLAGVYDWHDKVLTLVTGPETLFGDAYSQRHGAVIAARIREGLLIHELTHAVQDQHFDMARLTAGGAWSDAAMAHLALVEGDATLVMLADMAGTPPGEIPRVSLLLRHMLDHPEQFSAMAPGVPGAAGPADEPAWFRETTVFSYVQGASFCAAVLERGGQRLLDYAFSADPPRSTEQILHPDKWLGRRDDPVAIAWPDLRVELPGYVKAAEGQLGELGIKILLRQGLHDPQRAEAAAAGWGGDRFAVYRRPIRGSAAAASRAPGGPVVAGKGEGHDGAETVLAWITDWDDSHDAARFAAAAGELGVGWSVERTAARRVVLLRGSLAAAERTALTVKLSKAPIEPGANRAVPAAAIDPERRIGAAGSFTAARLAARPQLLPDHPLSTGHLGEDRRTYSYPEVGLTLRLPLALSSWQARAPTSPLVLQVLGDPEGDSLYVSATDGRSTLPLETLEPFYEQSRKSSLPGFAKLDGRLVEASGQRAYELHFSFTRGGAGFQRLERLFQHGTQLLIVAIEAREDRWAEMEPLARELLAGVTVAPAAPPAEPRPGGIELLLEVRIDQALAADARAAVMRREVETLRIRLGEALGDPGPRVEELAGERIMLRLAPPDSPDRRERARRLVMAGGQVELRLAAYPERPGPGVGRAEILSHYGGRLPADVEVLESRMARREQPGDAGAGIRCFAVEKRRAVTSSDFSAVRMDTGVTGQPAVTLSLQPEAARRLGELTLANLGRILAIVVDDEVMLAPVINGPITDTAMIEGNFTPEEAADLAIAMRHPLPAGVKCREERTILEDGQLGPPRPCQ